MASEEPTDASADERQAAAAPAPGAAGSVFAITVPATTVTLDAQRQATVPFTVSNTSGRALRGGTLLVTPDAAVKPWLTIAGDVDRDFPVGATQQYPVRIAVPTSAAPGSYSFHLDARDLANPDEDYAQGPSVAFQVTQAPAPPPPPRFPWWIAAVIVAVVVVVGVILFLVLRNHNTPVNPPPATATPTAAGVTAPGVIGQLAPNAEATIQTSGLQVGTVTTRIIAVGTAQVVVAQTPAPSTVVPRNSSVNLVVTGQPRVIVDQPNATIATGQALNLVTGAPGPASATSVSYSTAPGKVGDTAVVDWVLQPPSGARFAVLPAGTPANHDTCVSALSAAQPSAAPLQTATIAAGTAYCIQQSNGNVSLLQVTSAKAQQLQAAPVAADTSLHVALTTWEQ